MSKFPNPVYFSLDSSRPDRVSPLLSPPPKSEILVLTLCLAEALWGCRGTSPSGVWQELMPSWAP